MRWSFAPLLLGSLLGFGCSRAAPPEPPPPPIEPEAIEGAAPEVQAVMMETVLYVLEDGVALFAPREDAEPSMRVAAQERYRILEQRPGWYRLETPWEETPAWLPESALRMAQELAPPSEIHRRLAD